MTADERVGLIRVKVERAKQHIADLDRAVNLFFDSGNYEIGTKDDPNTRERILYLARLNPIPTTIAVIAGDALYDLRSALDHLAYQLFVIGTGGLTIDRRIEFPIADTAAELKLGTFRRKVKGMRPAAVKAIDDAEPYKGGKGDIFWRLHTLNIIDKHRALNVLVLRRRSANLTAQLFQALERRMGHPLPRIDAFFFLTDAERLRTLQVGDEVDRFPSDTNVDEKMYPRFEIAFGEPQVVEGKSVVETVQAMAVAVANLISEFTPLLA